MVIPLGDWAAQHDADVAVVEQLILESGQLTPGTPQWQMCVATAMDVLSKHVMDEENQIFGRLEQVWDAAQLEQLGAKMQELMTKTTRTKPTKKSAPTRRRR